MKFLLLILFLLSPLLQAADNDFRVSLSIASYHTKDRDLIDYAEFNPGIAIDYKLEQSYYLTGGFYKNSWANFPDDAERNDGIDYTIYLGLGYRWQPYHNLAIGIEGGLADDLGNNENREYIGKDGNEYILDGMGSKYGAIYISLTEFKYKPKIFFLPVKNIFALQMEF